MLKFLRKYNKWILVVAACFLMVAFLAPQAIQQWGQNQEKRVVARIGEQRVTVRDLRFARAESNLAELILPPGLLEERQEDIHWLLLATEAERGGYIGGAGDGARLLEEAAEDLAYQMGFQQWLGDRFQGIPQQFLQQIAGQVEPQWRSQWLSDQQMQDALVQQARNFILNRVQMPMTQQELYRSLGRVRGVRRMIGEWAQAGILSERRSLSEIKELGRQAWGRALFLPAGDLAAAEPEPTEEEIQAHFERFSDVSAEEGQYGFGYTLPARLKLEAMIIDRAAIEAAITPDAIEVRKLWASDRQGDQRYPEEFSAAREMVEAEVRRRIADSVMEIARQAIGAALLPSIRQLEEQGAYRVVTEDYLAQRPALEVVAQAVKQRVAEATFPLAAGGKVEIPAPVVTVHDRWLTPQDVSELEGVGAAALQYAGGNVPLSRALFEVREIAGENNLGLQQGVTPVQMPARTPDGSLVYYTVLDTRPQSPPDSMDEIRDQVTADLKALRAYERLQAQLEEYRSLAVAEGLEAVAARFAELLPAPQGEAGAEGQPQPPEVSDEVRFTTQGASQEGLMIDELSHEAVLDAVLDAAEQIDPAAPIDQIDPAQAIVAQPVDKELGVAFVRILAPRPVTREDFRAAAMAYTQIVMGREMEALAIEDHPFSFPSLRDRLGYIDLDRGRDEDAPPEGEAVPGAPADEPAPDAG